MHIYEVVRWGNASDDPLTGGSSGPDTCFLVRAPNVEAAAALVDRELSLMRRDCDTEAGNEIDWSSGAIYLLGDDTGSEDEARILRGPYYQHAYRHGWRHWYREEDGAGWVEREQV